MDLNKHESDRQRAGARRQTGGLQEADELESFKEELLRAIAPLELRMSPKAEAPFSRSGPVSRPGLVQGTDHDVLAAASVQRPSKSKPSKSTLSKSTLSKSTLSKSKLLVFGTMAAIVGGVLIGVTIAAADMEQVTLADLSVTRWLAQLTSASPDATKSDGARATLQATLQATLNDTTARAEPSPVSAQAAPTTEAAIVPDRPPSSQTTSSSAEAAQPADLAQPAIATSDRGQDGSPRKDENASPANEGTLAASSANASSLPVAGTEDKNSELYREFMAWQASREKPQSEQRRSALPSKRPAEAHASRTHHANTANVTGNRSRSSSRANESLARSNPKDKTDVAQQSSSR